jgi:hypothetical protein
MRKQCARIRITKIDRLINPIFYHTITPFPTTSRGGHHTTFSNTTAVFGCIAHHDTLWNNLTIHGRPGVMIVE